MEGHLEVHILHHILLLILITFCTLSHCTDLVEKNLVQNPSFERQEKWHFKQKIGMWRVENASDQQIRYNKDDMIKEGGQSLIFIPVLDKQIEAIWASQFIPLYNNHDQQYLFKFSYQVRGKESLKLKAKLDVSYRDRTNLFVSTQNDQVNGDEFSTKCIIVPAYGIVRAMMLHFVLEDKITDPIYLDDVNLQVMSTMNNNNCEVYVNTLPNSRHVIPNFLSPTTTFKENVKITLATQMTIDRLQYLMETAKIWQGPISLTLLLLEDSGISASNTLKTFVTKYYTEEILYKYVSVHVVAEDRWNKEDSTMYPVNFLRNIAINFVTSSYVFLIDADISPNFSEKIAQLWVSDAIKQSENCKTCAFIIPLFHIKQIGSRLPENKEELIKVLKNSEKDYAVIEAFSVASHSVVQYHKWYNANEPYQVNYREDMEPYFIVHTDAPMMNSMYRGYGRDKCAYSRDLHNANYKFVVLTEGFLLNKPTLQGGTTMLHRSRGLKLHVFLTISFHLEELRLGIFTWPNSKPASNVRTDCSSNDPETITDSCDMNKHRQEHVMYQKQQNIQEDVNKPPLSQNGKTGNVKDRILVVDKSQSNTKDNIKIKVQPRKDDVVRDSSNIVTTDGSFNCNNYKTISAKVSMKTDNTRNFLNLVPPDRKEILVEKVMKIFGTYTYIELPSVTMQGILRMLIPLIHPEAIISINPNSETNDMKVDGVFYSYQSTESISQSLVHVKKKHNNPCTVVLNLKNIFFSDSTSKVEAVKSILDVLTNADVFIIECINCNVNLIMSTMCKVKATWQLFTLMGEKSDYLILKSISLSEHPPLTKIPLPAISNLKEEPVCKTKLLKTDIIMVTKNRPLQTLSFLESLNIFIEGVNKVWIIQKSDDDLFDQGYNLVRNMSMAFYFDVQFLNEGMWEFGIQIQHALKSSESDCIIFGVDEMMWLRKHNLQQSCCLLQDDEIASVQLRLGKRLSIFPPAGKIGELLMQERLFPLKYNNNIYVYYPCFWPYDFGYVVHIDGLMMKRINVMDELGEHLPDMKSPSNLEQRWILLQLHNHVRKWHIMFDQSILVNNMWLQDGRVAGKVKPVPESYELCKMFLKDRKKIDVKSFAKKHKDVIKATHVKKPVEFINY